MKIVILKEVPAFVSESFLKDLIKKICKKLIQKGISKKRLSKNLNLAFVSSYKMRNLQKRFRGKTHVTDILSFAPSFSEDLGDLVLCVDKIKGQSKAHKLTFKQELSYLLIHGILHLLGFEHEKSKKGAKKMYNLQDAIFESIALKG